MKISIGGREFEAVPTYGSFRKLVNRYPDFDEMNIWTINKYNDFIFDGVWILLPRIFFIFKPFLFKKRMMNNLTLAELKYLQLNFHKILLGEDVAGSVEEFNKLSNKEIREKGMKEAEDSRGSLGK